MNSSEDKKFLSLNKKLLSIFLAVSILFTLFWTIANIVMENNLAKEIEISRNQHIENVLVPGVEISAWNFDIPQLQLQLEGILSNTNITQVVLIDEDAKDKPIFDLKKPGVFF